MIHLCAFHLSLTLQVIRYSFNVITFAAFSHIPLQMQLTHYMHYHNLNIEKKKYKCIRSFASLRCGFGGHRVGSHHFNMITSLLMLSTCSIILNDFNRRFYHCTHIFARIDLIDTFRLLVLILKWTPCTQRHINKIVIELTAQEDLKKISQIFN